MADQNKLKLNLQAVHDSFQEKLPETPFYFYSEEILDQLWQAHTRDFAKASIPVRPHFPVKANNNPHVLKFFQSKGAGADAVSGGEVKLALAAGIHAKEINFAGVGKSDTELEYAVDAGVGLVCLESPSELRRLEAITNKKQKSIGIAVRVNPNVDAKTHPYISTGLHGHKFGVDFKQAFELYAIAHKSKFVECRGISMHIGSQIFELSAYEQAISETLHFAQQLKTQGIELSVLDIGGGLGVNYDHPYELPKFAEFARLALMAAEKWQALFPRANSQIVSECGRALVAQAGLLVTRVIAIKHGATKNFAVLDASMTELIRPSLYKSEHRIEALLNHYGTPQSAWQFVGPVCESSDVLLKEIQLREVQEGELFFIHSAGAYGYVMASQYNARALPAEWWWGAGKAPVCSRQRREFEG